MERRRAIQLLAAAASGLWADPQFPATLQDLPVRAPLLPLFPLDLVLFPHTNLPLHIFEERYKEMIQDCLKNQWEFGMLLVQDQSVKTIGCTASISEVVDRYPDGRLNILVRGQRRFEISMLNEAKSYLRGKPQFFEDEANEPAADEQFRQRAIQLYARLKELAEVVEQSLQEPPTAMDTQLSYRLMAGLPGEPGWKQSLLELRSERERLALVTHYFEEWIEYFERPATPRQIALLFPGLR